VFEDGGKTYLVEPDTPANVVLLVDFELLAEQVVALLVDLLVVLVVGTGVDGAELAVPVEGV